MIKTQVMPCTGTGKNTKDKKVFNFSAWAPGISFAREYVIVIGIAFLLGRVKAAGGLMPFGLAFFAAAYAVNKTGVKQLLVGIAVLAGILSAGIGAHLIIYASSLVVFSLLMFPWNKSRNISVIRLALTSFFSLLLPNMTTAWLQNFLLYDILKALFESFIVFVLVFIFKNSMCILDANLPRKAFSAEEVISVSILLSLCIAGFSDINVYGFSLKNILCIFFILLFSFRFGAGVGAGIGVAMGLIASMSTSTTPYVIGSYGFCGLLSGVFKGFGKAGSSLGFVLGNAILTIYLTGSSDAIIQLGEIIASIILFVIIPGKLFDVFAPFMDGSPAISLSRKDYLERIKEITVQKLNKFSNAFGELARTFNEISETRVETSKQDISNLFDRVAERVCKDCSLCLHCWDRNFYSTYQVSFKIIERLDEKGWVEEKDVPDYFRTKCVRIDDFLNAVNNLYEVFKVDMIWKKKVNESRGLVSQQFEGLSRIISGLADEISMDVEFKEELESNIVQELVRIGVKIAEAIVLENKWGKYEVSLFVKNSIVKNPGENRKIFSSTVEKKLSDILGRRVAREQGDDLSSYMGSYTIYRFVERERFSILAGVARMAKGGGSVSGDSYTFMNIESGKYLVAVSDGMGWGQRASLHSSATINLLEEFLQSGFDKDTAVKIINSILVLKSVDDAFATIDLSVVDLQSGEAEFMKVGAIPTYIKREDRVEMVKSASLPAGILQNIDMELAHKKLCSGDFIIMMTDGILDSSADKSSRESWMAEFIGNIKSANPQEIADLILDEAYRNYNAVPGDDMTVVAAKLWEHV